MYHQPKKRGNNYNHDLIDILQQKKFKTYLLYKILTEGEYSTRIVFSSSAKDILAFSEKKICVRTNLNK